MRSRWAIFIVGLVTAVSARADWYVDKRNATGVQDGCTWATAFDDIQEGIDAAHAAGGGTVRVAGGHYNEMRNGSDGELVLRPGVALVGGYAGGAQGDVRDLALYPSIVDGARGLGGQPALHVVAGSDGAIFDGFTVTGGRARETADGTNDTIGSGMLNLSVSPMVVNCLFRDGLAETYGGAVANVGGAAQFVSCTFTGNVAARGGAVYGTQGARPEFYLCHFRENRAPDVGGAVYSDQAAPRFVRCTFTANAATHTTALPDGAANRRGGAVFGGATAETTIFEACSFVDNWVDQKVLRPLGGALHLNGPARISNCVFHKNYVYPVTLDAVGGAVYVNSGHCTIINSTFAHNADAKYTIRGGYEPGAGATITNTIVWPGSIGSINAQVDHSSTQYRIYSGAGNITGDPQFLDGPGGNLRLNQSSPCINTGTTLGAPEIDAVGTFRPQGAAVDMGAYELRWASPWATVTEAWWTDSIDVDADGYFERSRLNWNPDVIDGTGTLDVIERVSRKATTETHWTVVGQTTPHAITDLRVEDSQYLDVPTAPHARYDYRIEVIVVGNVTADSVRGAEWDPDLRGHGEEAVPLRAKIDNVYWSNEIDGDRDGYYEQSRLNWSSEAVDGPGPLSVCEEVYRKLSGSASWTLLASIPEHSLTGGAPAQANVLPVNDLDRIQGSYDYRVVIYRAGESTADDTVDITGHLEEPYAATRGSLQVFLEPTEVVAAGARWRVDGDFWRKSGTIATMLEPGYHTLEFSPLAGWNVPDIHRAGVAAGETTSIVATYTRQTGVIRVGLSPDGALALGAQWRVDGGEWQVTDGFVADLIPGAHSLSFKPLDGWQAPQTEQVQVIGGQVLELQRSYMRATVKDVWWSNQVDGDGDGYYESFRLNWSRDAAGGEGTLRVVDKLYRKAVSDSSWVVVAQIPARGISLPGDVSFVDLAGLDPRGRYDYRLLSYREGQALPDVTVDPISRAVLGAHQEEASAESTGTLRVTIAPEGAVSAGALWRVDGGSWQAGGATVAGLSVGTHSVEFKEVAYWTRPATQSVSVTVNATATLVGTYTIQTGALTVTLEPSAARSAGAAWRILGGDHVWQLSGATLSQLRAGQGIYSVEFKEISGWIRPLNQTVTISANQTTSTSAVYSSSTQTGSVRVTITPPEAVSAGAAWCLDGGAWRASGYTLTGVSVGSHTVSFKPAPGWQVPSSRTVSVTLGQTAAVSASYTPVTEPVPGDVNGDSRCDAMDVQLVINSALGLAATTSTDINNDGKHDAMDVQLVINAVLSRP